MEQEKSGEIFYNAYKNFNGDLTKIEYYANNYQLSVKKFLGITMSYIKNNVVKPQYAILLDKLLKLKTKEQIIKFLNKTNFSLYYLESNILAYFILYRPDIYYLKPDKRDELREKLNIYKLYLKEKDEEKIKTTNKLSLEYITYILNLFLMSNYTVERFSYNKGIALRTFKNYLLLIKNANPNLYDNVNLKIEIMEKRKEVELPNEVYKILEMIENDKDNFTILEFLESTFCSIKEILKVADEILNPAQNKIFRMTISKFKNEYNFLDDNSINSYLNENFIFNFDGNLINITNEDKEKAINYLQSKDIPICLSTFKSACYRMYKESIKKTKILKK